MHLHHSVGVCVSLANEYSFDLCPVVRVAVYIARLAIFPFQTVHCYRVAQIMKNLSCTSVELSDLQADVCLCLCFIDPINGTRSNEAHRMARIW